MDQLLTDKGVFFQAMYEVFKRRTQRIPEAYRSIGWYLAEEKVREFVPTVKWFA